MSLHTVGNDTSTTPQPVLNYLDNVRPANNRPFRIRIGGNSMDSSTYVPSQQGIVAFENPAANSNDQSVDYGPELFDVMNGVSKQIGGAQYLIGTLTVSC